MTKHYEVKAVGTAIETYIVEAESIEDAEKIYADFEPDVSEVIDTQVIGVKVL